MKLTDSNFCEYTREKVVQVGTFSTGEVSSQLEAPNSRHCRETTLNELEKIKKLRESWYGVVI